MKKKPIAQVYTCFQCQFAYLMRSAPRNPIVSECTITKEREVASTLLKCEYFKPRAGDAVINPMKYLK